MQNLMKDSDLFVGSFNSKILINEVAISLEAEVCVDIHTTLAGTSFFRNARLECNDGNILCSEFDVVNLKRPALMRTNPGSVTNANAKKATEAFATQSLRSYTGWSSKI